MNELWDAYDELATNLYDQAGDEDEGLFVILDRLRAAIEAVSP